MTPVDMLHLESGKSGATKGDCFRCCVASLLDLPRDDVPHFIDNPEGQEHEWLARVQQWLAPRGLFYLVVDRIPWCCLKRSIRPLAIVGGASPRGPWGHCVVGEVTRDGWRLVHDPHPSRAGIVGDPEDMGVFARLCEVSP